MTGPGEKRTGFLELFFDLVFVFAVTQLVGMLEDDHGLSGWFHVVLMAWMVWWAWSQFTWAGNAIDLDRRPTRVAVLGITGVTLLFAAALPAAFGDGGGWRFAVPYVMVRLAALGLYWAGLRHDPEHQAALRSYLPVAAVSPAVILAGAAAPDSARQWVWLAAVAIDIASALAAGRGEFHVSPGHFAERHALFVIIALGEAVVGVGATLAGTEVTPVIVGTTAAAFLIVASQWWGYFDWVQGAAEDRLASEDDLRRRGHLARDLFTFGHLPIVLGTVVLAAGLEHALAHPDEALDVTGRTMVGVGLGLFLTGFVAGNLRATGRLLPERIAAGAAVAAVVTLVAPHVTASVLLWLLAAVLVAVAAVETVRRRCAVTDDRSTRLTGGTG
jgi:low temperature requirement protein LtrA